VHFESKQDFVFIRQVAYHAAQRRGQLLDQGWRREDFLIFGALWILENIDDLELVLSFELLFADALQIPDCDSRSGTRAGDVKGQQVFGQKSSSLTASWIELFPELANRLFAGSKLCRTRPARCNTEVLLPRNPPHQQN
jgi:hypothetical protein